MQDLRAMVMFHDLAAQLKSFCTSVGKDSSRAPLQIADCEVNLIFAVYKLGASRFMRIYLDGCRGPINVAKTQYLL